MSIMMERGSTQLPPSGGNRPPELPIDPEDEKYWEGQFRRGSEPFPTDDLSGRVHLEDRIASAHADWESGSPLGKSAMELLRTADEYVLDEDHYDSYREI